MKSVAKEITVDEKFSENLTTFRVVFSVIVKFHLKFFPFCLSKLDIF